MHCMYMTRNIQDRAVFCSQRARLTTHRENDCSTFSDLVGGTYLSTLNISRSIERLKKRILGP